MGLSLIFRPVDDLEKHSTLDHFGFEIRGPLTKKAAVGLRSATAFLFHMVTTRKS